MGGVDPRPCRWVVWEEGDPYYAVMLRPGWGGRGEAVGVAPDGQGCPQRAVETGWAGGPVGEESWGGPGCTQTLTQQQEH